MSDNKKALSAVLKDLVAARDPIFSEEIIETLDVIIEQLGQITIEPMTGTKMICNRCYSVNSAGYVLKRSAGKYLAFCVEECSGKEVHPNCSFVDCFGVNCDQLAEYQIKYGSDELLSKYSCVFHVGVLLTSSEQKVYSIK